MQTKVAYRSGSSDTKAMRLASALLRLSLKHLYAPSSMLSCSAPKRITAYVRLRHCHIVLTPTLRQALTILNAPLTPPPSVFEAASRADCFLKATLRHTGEKKHGHEAVYDPLS